MKDTELCPKCHGTGWELYIENGVEYARKCSCGYLDKEIMQSKLEFANIPSAFKDMRLKDFKLSVYRQEESRQIVKFACDAIKYWLDNLEEMESNGKGLFLFSNAKGSGKTRMAASIANELIHERKKLVKFATSIQILNEIKASWHNKDESEEKLLSDLSRAPYLVIDDFGTEVPRDWIGDKFYSIINQRYVDRKPTIFTSNHSLETLQYDERITNRIVEMCFQIPFPEESVRNYIAMQNDEEMLKGLKNGNK